MPPTHVNIMRMFKLSDLPSDLRVCVLWCVLFHVASETEQLRVHVFSLGADPYCCFSLRECICLHVCVSVSQSRKKPLLNQSQGPAPPPVGRLHCRHVHVYRSQVLSTSVHFNLYDVF